MKDIIKIRKTTTMFLALVALLMGIWSIAVDYKLIQTSLEVGMLTALMFSGIIVSEIGINSILRRHFGTVEVIGLSAVLITLLTVILNFFEVNWVFLGAIAGTVKVFLIVIAVAMIFTKQKGE